MEIKQYLSKQRVRIEEAMGLHFPAPTGVHASHIESMRYSLFAGGKRIRPILCLAAADAIGAEEEVIDELMPIATALECIHTYSLIHDDLPAMDNDELRRGKPTNHMVFGEANAILAGDGLLTMAFELMSMLPENCRIPPSVRLSISHVIAQASGSFGMVGGQVLDINNENKKIPFDLLATIHKNKTGALIRASVLSGALAAQGTQKQIAELTRYGEMIGLAFQIVDDLLNATSTTEQLGKKAGSDAELGKSTYPAYFGISKTREKAYEAVTAAKEALMEFNHKAEPLRALADYIYTRSH